MQEKMYWNHLVIYGVILFQGIIETFSEENHFVSK